MQSTDFVFLYFFAEPLAISTLAVLVKTYDICRITAKRKKEKEKFLDPCLREALSWKGAGEIFPME